MSSSSASQCNPTRLNSTCPRSVGVARKSRGNHASGTPSVRPSVSSTHIVCSSKRTLVAEMVIRSIVARMERSAIRDRGVRETAPDIASLHPGYTCYGLTTSLFCGLIDPASDIAMAVA